MIEGENTIMPILQFEGEDPWTELLKPCALYLDDAGLKRLKSALESTAKTVFIERHYIDRDYRDTFSNFHSKRFSTPNARTLRLHFFDTQLTRADLENPDKLQAHYVGYSIIRPTRPNAIGRTLLNPHKLPYVKGEMAVCEEKVTIQTSALKIQGFPFISQDTDVTVCAQSALWMLLRFFSNKFSCYREFLPYQITLLTEDYSLGRICPASGLTAWQIAEACRRAGFSPLLYSRSQLESVGHNFDHIMYTYVESGIPVLAGISKHVFPLFGHDSDYSGSLPKGCRIVASSHFNQNFLINDDNGFPYQALRKEGPNSKSLDSEHRFSDIKDFTVALPEKVYLAAEEVEILINKVMETYKFGYGSNSPMLNGADRLITRLFLTSGRSFKLNIPRRGMGAPRAKDAYTNLPLPHFIWVAEISVPSLYPRQVLGEIVWDATRNANEGAGWISIHYPERMFVDIGSAFNGNPDIQRIELDNNAPYPIYTNNLTGV